MIINGKDYNIKCECGKEHSMATEICVIENDCINHISKYIKEFNLEGITVAIYDENTYNAKNMKHPNVFKEIILNPNGLHSDNHGIDKAISMLPEKFDTLIAIGGGTIHDITRYIAYKYDAEFISCPTAASVDGFCSSVACLTWNGFKKTFTAKAPKIVIADLDIIKNAPIYLTRSGFGDMIGKLIALTDWKIGKILTNENFCQRIYDITFDATKKIIDSTDDIVTGKNSGYENLVYGLLMSGLAMQMLGYSRCASGAEHHISHFIETAPKENGIYSDNTHGEKVGVGTIIASEVYHKTINKHFSFGDYSPETDENILKVFGDVLGESIIKENKEDNAKSLKSEFIKEKWNEICEEVKQIPTKEELLKLYNKIGAKTSLEDLGISNEKLDFILKYSPLVRNRVTLMRLIRGCN